MIFSAEAQDLVTEWKAALAANAAVIKEFDALIKQGNVSATMAVELTRRMNETRLKAADLLDRLQPFRLDS